MPPLILCSGVRTALLQERGVNLPSARSLVTPNHQRIRHQRASWRDAERLSSGEDDAVDRHREATRRADGPMVSLVNHDNGEYIGEG